GEARSHRDLPQPELSLPDHFHGATKAQMDDVTIGAHADRATEHAREVELAPSCHPRERRDVDWLVEMRHQIVPQTSKDGSVEESPDGLETDGVVRHQLGDEATRRLVPEQGPPRVATGALRREESRQMQQAPVVPDEALGEPSVERAVLGG